MLTRRRCASRDAPVELPPDGLVHVAAHTPASRGRSCDIGPVPRNAFPGFLRTRCGDFSALTLPLSISGADSIAKKRRFYWRARTDSNRRPPDSLSARALPVTAAGSCESVRDTCSISSIDRVRPICTLQRAGTSDRVTQPFGRHLGRPRWTHRRQWGRTADDVKTASGETPQASAGASRSGRVCADTGPRYGNANSPGGPRSNCGGDHRSTCANHHQR